MPSKAGLGSEVRSANSQRDNRFADTLFDQHKSVRFPRGRPWYGMFESPNEKRLDPGWFGELCPGDHDDPFNSVWTAPWFPTQLIGKDKQYFRFDYKRRTLTWMYGTMIADDQAAIHAYYEAAAQIAYTKGWVAPGLGEPVSYQIRMILRKPPRSPKIAEAAQAGDPWLLGFTEQVNEQLAEILAGTRPDTLLSPAFVTPEIVLAKPDDLEERIARAVAAALQARDTADALKTAKNKARMANVRAKRVPASAPAIAPYSNSPV